MNRIEIDSAEGTEGKFGVVFTIIGLITLAIAIVLVVLHINFVANSDEVEAIVTDVYETRDSDGDRVTHVFVTYEYEGNVYSNINYNGIGTSVLGETVTIKVNRDDPRDISGGSSLLVAGFLCIFTLAFGGIGISTLKKSKKKKRLKKMLLNEGRVILATVENIYVDRSITVNGRSPLRLTCSYTDSYSGMQYAFESEKVWNDLFAMYKRGMNVNVYVLGNDYSKYYVDLENYIPAPKVVDFS